MNDVERALLTVGVFMDKLDFILWMTLFPISQSLCSAITYQWCERKKFSDGIIGLSSLCIIVIWLGIGYAMW